MYPEIEPYYIDKLAVSSRHSLYVERSGRRGGMPVIFVHGGPGSRVNAQHRRYFDPEFFDIVLFDQRGCGKSTPLGEVEDNDTGRLVEDIEAIRRHLGIEHRVCLFGGSWGATLALAYAREYPEHVEEMILRGVFLGTREEVDWYTHGLARFAPQAWEAFASPGCEDLLAYYSEEVFAQDPARALAAARAWVGYEAQLMMIGTGNPCPDITLVPREELLARARVQLHYLRHACFLGDNPLLASAQELSMPVTIVQGELDLVCPPVTAYRLSRALPNARLRLVNAGHGGLSEPLATALCEETDRLRARIKERDESSL
ncbi:MAG: alpha/beta fold hydrolase [Pseudomonadales bacterium]|nr:alpha/beta fold hydrolase [Pseudomonadales bacterium]MCP5329413.1 alpha/beta fold hydrolase [Pseudomonadales bacterium]